MTSVNHGPNNTPILFARDTGSGLADYVGATNNKLNVNATISATSLPASFIYGNATTTGSAVQFAANALTQGVIIEALSTNAANVYVGDASVTSSTGFELQPGQATSVAVSNTNTLYVTGTNGDKVRFIGS